MSLKAGSIPNAIFDAFAGSASLVVSCPGGLVADRDDRAAAKPYAVFDITSWENDFALGDREHPVETLIVEFRWYSDTRSATPCDAVADDIEDVFGQDAPLMIVANYTHINSKRFTGPIQRFENGVWEFTAEYEMIFQRTS